MITATQPQSQHSNWRLTSLFCLSLPVFLSHTITVIMPFQTAAPELQSRRVWILHVKTQTLLTWEHWCWNGSFLLPCSQLVSCWASPVWLLQLKGCMHMSHSITLLCILACALRSLLPGQSEMQSKGLKAKDVHSFFLDWSCLCLTKYLTALTSLFGCASIVCSSCVFMSQLFGEDLFV